MTKGQKLDAIMDDYIIPFMWLGSIGFMIIHSAEIGKFISYLGSNIFYLIR